MWFTIIVIAVLFFLGRKLNNDHPWMQAICFFWMLTATIILCSHYFSWPRVSGYICWGVLLFLAKLTAPANSDQESQSIEESSDNLAKSMGSSEGKQNLSNGTADVNSSAVDALIDEVVEVVNDMLEVGMVASIISYSDHTDYRGCIQVLPFTVSFAPQLVGYKVVMHSVSDLESRRYGCHIYGIPDQEEKMDQLDEFIQKYSDCYNAKDKQYEYTTRKNILVPNSCKQIPQGKIVDYDRLLCEIKSRCPLAEVFDWSSRGSFYTKTVSRG